jgi:hypothetical protein
LPPSIEDVVARVSREAFGRPLVTNVLRGQVVEAIVAMALEPDWKWCAGDYSSWDFERADGLRLEVKQSAARQTWAAPSHGRINPSFDIKARSGRWEGATFVAEPGRAAHIYLFAYHPRADADADHRDPLQWEFFVVATSRLPATQRVGLAALQKLCDSVAFDELGAKVSAAETDLGNT